MRLHSNVSRSRGRLVVLKLGAFVGLLILLMVATIACDNTEPLLEPASIQESTGTSAPTPTPDGTDVSQSPSPTYRSLLPGGRRVCDPPRSES